MPSLLPTKTSLNTGLRGGPAESSNAEFVRLRCKCSLGRHLWAPHVIHTQAWGSRGPSPTSLPACPRLPCVRSRTGAAVAHLAEHMVQVSRTSRLGNLCLLRPLPKPVRSACGLQEKEPSWLRKRLQAQPQTSRPDPTGPGSGELSVQAASSSQPRGRLFFF